MNRKFTIEQHYSTANTIRQMNHQLNDLLRDIAKAYGLSSRETALVDRVKSHLSNLRSILDSAIIKENPNTPIKFLNFYYNPELKIPSENYSSGEKNTTSQI